MKELKKLSELKLLAKDFEEWSLEYQSPCNNYRLYSVKEHENQRFEVIALSLETSESEDNDGWNKTTKAKELFSGEAVFDGIRHLTLNDYINYPLLEDLSKMFLIVSSLEKEICETF